MFASSGTLPAAPTPPPAVPLAGPITASDAARLLAQATFGPTDDLIAQVQAGGVKNFLNEQFKLPATSHTAYLEQLGITPDEKGRADAQIPWWQNAVNAPDQLRQRVAFALSEIMVVSGVGPAVSRVTWTCSARIASAPSVSFWKT